MHLKICCVHAAAVVRLNDINRAATSAVFRIQNRSLYKNKRASL